MGYGHTDYCPRFINWPKFVQEKLRSQEFGEYNDMRRWRVLVLDDIGAERDNTGFATEYLCSLLNSRLGRWTIITSNLGMSELETVDTRIPSRMIRGGSVVVQLTCPDFNTRTK